MPIGAVARLTGVPVTSLRAWESRHGFPTPRRRDGTHRRYDTSDVEAIRRVVEARRAGLSLDAAIAMVRADERPRSIYSAVRNRYPELATRTVTRQTMLAVSRAVEDECCARAASPLLVAAFQEPSAYEPARERWIDLARTASEAVVLATFPTSRRRRRGPAEIAVDDASPLVREWAVICDAPRASACLVGWERAGAPHRSAPHFEAFWSVDPRIVRTAARAALTLAHERAPDLDVVALATLPELGAEPTDPERLVALAERIVANLDGALRRRLTGTPH